MPISSLDLELRQRVVDHIVDEVGSARVEDYPFPHIGISEFFPRDVYQRLLELLPSWEEYENFSYEKHSNKDGESNRRRFRLENECLDRLTPAQKTFWYSIRSALGSTAVKDAVFDKLALGLSYRFGCEPKEVAGAVSGFALPELFRETKGYFIKPHPDTRKKVVTMQISLARDESQKNLGTEFYRRSLSPASLFRQPRGFEIVKTMPFLPNAAYAFVVLNTLRLKSWHGRSQLSEASGARDSILNIWYQKPEHANREIVEENRTLAEQCVPA